MEHEIYILVASRKSYPRGSVKERNYIQQEYKNITDNCNFTTIEGAEKCITVLLANSFPQQIQPNREYVVINPNKKNLCLRQRGHAISTIQWSKAKLKWGILKPRQDSRPRITTIKSITL